jgi:hypothetical protein
LDRFVDTQVELKAAGAIALAGFGAVLAGSRRGTVAATGSKSTVVAGGKVVVAPKVDISVPYDAAALLAYDSWRGSLLYDESTFQKFKTIYEEKTVAEVGRKRVLRELDAVAQKADNELATLLSQLSESAKLENQ